MQAPHVESLYFDLILSRKNDRFDNPPPVDWAPSHGQARYRLENGVLIAWPSDHFATVDAARALVRPDLDAWESTAELELGVGAIQFRYRHATIIDRAPPKMKDDQGSFRKVTARDSLGLGLIERATVTRIYHSYPALPGAFNAEADIVRDLMARFRQQAREPLLSMVYAMLSRIESEAGGRKSATTRYRIEQSVLRKLGDLSSEGRGGPLEARKFKAGIKSAPLSASERQWLQEAIRAVIRQVAAVEAGTEPNILTMENLPPLETDQRN